VHDQRVVTVARRSPVPSLVDLNEITTRASQTNGQLNRQSLRTIWEVGLKGE